MKKSKLFFLLIIGIIFAGINLNAAPVLHLVTVQDFTFNPDNITNVRPGDTVRWIWINGSHTTTSTTIPSGAAVWDKVLDVESQSFDYIPTIPGVYHYKCSNHSTSGMIGQFTVLDLTGIKGNVLIPKITLYPNPLKDIVNLNCVLPEGVFIQGLTIYDVSGRIIQEASFNEKSTFPVALNLSDVSEGMIVFEFIDNQNRSFILRAVRKE